MLGRFLSCPRQPPALGQEAPTAPHSGAGWALTVGSLCKDSGSDGREEDDADDVAPVILNEALELLDLLLDSVPLVLLPLCFCVQMQLVLVHPGKHRSAGVTARFPWQENISDRGGLQSTLSEGDLRSACYTLPSKSWDQV